MSDKAEFCDFTNGRPQMAVKNKNFDLIISELFNYSFIYLIICLIIY